MLWDKEEVTKHPLICSGIYVVTKLTWSLEYFISLVQFECWLICVIKKVDARRLQIIFHVFLVMLTSDIILKVIFYTYRDNDSNLGDILEALTNILLLFSSTE